MQLNETDRIIVRTLRFGNNTPANIARRTDHSRQYIGQRIDLLRELGVVARTDRGVYALLDDPFRFDRSEDSDSEDSEDSRASEGGGARVDRATHGSEFADRIRRAHERKLNGK